MANSISKEDALKLILYHKQIEFDGHWLSTKGRNRYTRVKFKGVKYNLHRLSAYVYLGLELSDLSQFACHTEECKLKNCFSPEHLYVGDNQQNQFDLWKDGKCKRGHKLDGYKSNGKRYCKTCQYHSARAWLNRKRQNAT